MDQQQPDRFVMSVLIGDRVGILRDVTSTVTDLGGTIDGISQTVVQGYFTVILTAAFVGGMTPDELRQALSETFEHESAFIAVLPQTGPGPGALHEPAARYIVTVTGPNRPTVLKAITKFLAQRGINVEDWAVTFDDPYVIHVGEVTIPSRLDIKQVQDEFHHLMSQLGLTSCLQHENIFRATNEVGSLTRLLSRSNHAENG